VSQYDLHLRSLTKRISPILEKYSTAGCIPFSEQMVDGAPSIEVEVHYGSEGCYPLYIEEVYSKKVSDSGDEIRPLKQKISLYLPEGFWYNGKGKQFVEEIKKKFCRAPSVEFKLIVMMNDGSVERTNVVDMEKILL
jgi:hypothetical protein